MDDGDNRAAVLRLLFCSEAGAGSGGRATQCNSTAGGTQCACIIHDVSLIDVAVAWQCELLLHRSSISHGLGHS